MIFRLSFSWLILFRICFILKVKLRLLYLEFFFLLKTMKCVAEVPDGYIKLAFNLFILNSPYWNLFSVVSNWLCQIDSTVVVQRHSAGAIRRLNDEHMH